MTPTFVALAKHVGPQSLSDSELVSIVCDLPKIEHSTGLLERAGGAGSLATFGPHALANSFGLSEKQAFRLTAAIELGLRVVRANFHAPLETIRTSREVARWAKHKFALSEHEELWLLMLDARHRVRREHPVARGGLTGCMSTAHDVLRPVVREAYPAFILAHNHPSGDPTPSSHDVAFTLKIQSAARILGIALVDHVVVARDSYVSMIDAGLIE